VATIEYWIQLENPFWDLCPNPRNIDRMTGKPPKGGAPKTVTLTSPVTGATTTRLMNMPIGHEDALHSALILRRYTENWAAPDDRKVNPWDVNEPDPTDTGTMGTIPGPVIECTVGDEVIVHFRNLDLRKPDGKLLPIEKRTHSLHPHGFVFDRFSDGAYPLSPPDPSQPVGAEAAAWAAVGVNGFKQGDRIPPPADPDNGIATAATYTYRWTTQGWPTTAGVWLYHDHSVCDMDNVEHGAIGIIVIHNRDDEQDVDVRDPANPARNLPALLPAGQQNGSPIRQDQGKDVFVDPPARALYLQLYHSLGHNSGMVINGRKFLGNTPTVVAGPETLMRFGVVGMNMEHFHTFHLHGHRWTIPGPDGTTPDAIQQSPQIRAVSQFEDTRIFGPANSFVFSIDNRSVAAGGVPSFMRAGGPGPQDGKGEWHMHCHVLMHMDDGMMGSLVVAESGDPVEFQAATLVCPPEDAHEPDTIAVTDFAFTPATLSVTPNTMVTFDFQAADHTVKTVSTTNATAIAVNNGGGPTDAVPVGQKRTVMITGSPGGVIKYQCGIHGAFMPGEIHLT
jgi:FtsP/CotA-like multicopper oxidase with cupredoxin domain/plastocyanin